MKNQTYTRAESIPLPVPEGTKSGDPVIVGALPGVAETDRDAAGLSAVRTVGANKFKVKGVKKGGNQKIEPGDIIYKKGAELNVNNEEGTRYGYALEAVEAGAEAEILVKIGY